MLALPELCRGLSLRQRYGVTVAEPDILTFHREVLRSIEHYGRTHKFEIMMRYKLRRSDWFSDAALGLKMFAKRKLELLPSRIVIWKPSKYFLNPSKRYRLMQNKNLIDLTYFPSCSLATTSKENNRPLIYLFRQLGFNLVDPRPLLEIIERS